MPVYAMCQKKCLKNEICLRFRAIPDEIYQPYANFVSLCCEEDGYQMFMRVRPNDKVRDLIEIDMVKPFEIKLAEERNED